MTTQPDRPRGGDKSRQLMMLKLTVAVLLGVAFLILILPMGIPKPIRIVVAMTDLIAAATIWLLGKQRLRA